ncbi:MAG: O-methyltransferase [Candidatus Heimdallarchaeota archaeon]|nr:O-methyltransferase [Candidatus Heimdallarchaeota archaeon]MBY8993948.1 O-methyltransferase [Candidatus Heimdallarchaeota archaeon]
MKKEIIDLLKELEAKDAEERVRGLPSSERMRNITPDVGLFLNILVKSTKAINVLEIGTSNGYSSIWLGLATQENKGQLITLEVDPLKVKMAKENLEKAGLANTVKLIEGDAKQTLSILEKKFDFVFLDAEKEDYLEYFHLIFPKLKVGGVIVADNVISHAEDLKEYINFVRANPNTQSVLVPIGRGEELTLKIR